MVDANCIYNTKNKQLSILFVNLFCETKLYIDTSVFGGNFDVEFAEYTIPLFERLNNGEFTMLFSTVTQDELENAPKNVKDLIKNIKSEHSEFLDIND